MKRRIRRGTKPESLLKGLEGRGPCIWTGTVSADWSDVRNWSGGRVPSKQDQEILLPFDIQVQPSG